MFLLFSKTSEIRIGAEIRIWVCRNKGRNKGVPTGIGLDFETCRNKAEIRAEIRAYQRGLTSIFGRKTQGCGQPQDLGSCEPDWRSGGVVRNKRRNKGLPTGIGLDLEADRNKGWGVQK